MKSRLIGAVTIGCTVWLLSAAADDFASPGVDPARLRCDGTLMSSLDELCRQAVGEDSQAAEHAIRQLRARGEFGLRTLLDVAAGLKQQVAGTAGLNDSSWQRLRAAIDAVSGQRDGHASQLFWFTDLEQARAAARAQARPILSLRLLGRLDEEFSCANSRFFRTTLYANQEVASYLREHFILHWKSVRPVPRVTIDFGDGRKLERTLTGNSIHYVLNSSGEVIDALPGLYGSKAFLAGLRRAEAVCQQTMQVQAGQRAARLSQYHRDRLAALDAELAADLQKVSPPTAGAIPVEFSVMPGLNAFAAPPADRAARVTVGKGFVERPILDRLQPRAPGQGPPEPAGLSDELWRRLAELHSGEAALDASALNLIREKIPSARTAGRLTASKIAVEDPVLRQIRNLQRSISEDTVRNEYWLHRQLHAWLAETDTPRDLEILNSRVYAELFLTPDSDPWLGLLPPDAFAALENGGLRLAGQTK